MVSISPIPPAAPARGQSGGRSADLLCVSGYVAEPAGPGECVPDGTEAVWRSDALDAAECMRKACRYEDVTPEVLDMGAKQAAGAASAPTQHSTAASLTADIGCEVGFEVAGFGQQWQ